MQIQPTMKGNDVRGRAPSKPSILWDVTAYTEYYVLESLRRSPVQLKLQPTTGFLVTQSCHYPLTQSPIAYAPANQVSGQGYMAGKRASQPRALPRVHGVYVFCGGPLLNYAPIDNLDMTKDPTSLHSLNVACHVWFDGR